jgi:hypothetical protein
MLPDVCLSHGHIRRQLYAFVDRSRPYLFRITNSTALRLLHVEPVAPSS